MMISLGVSLGAQASCLPSLISMTLAAFSDTNCKGQQAGCLRSQALKM